MPAGPNRSSGSGGRHAILIDGHRSWSRVWTSGRSAFGRGPNRSSAARAAILRLQLGAAIVAAENHPATLPIVTLDERFAPAAEREGFPVSRFDQVPSKRS